MKSFIFGVLLGTVVLFMWGWISWQYLPVHSETFTALPDEEATRLHLIQQKLKTGAYVIPAQLNMYPDFDEMGEMLATERQKKLQERQRVGPMVTIFYREKPGSPLSGKTMTNGFVLNLIGVLIVSILLKCSLHSCRWYIQRVLFVALIGVFLAIMGDATQWNWMLFPAKYIQDMMWDHIIAWVLVGIVLAFFIKPRKPAEDSE